MCKVMVFAVVDTAGATIMSDGEEVTSWLLCHVHVKKVQFFLLKISKIDTVDNIPEKTVYYQWTLDHCILTV